MTAYYNEHDLHAAQWLRNLIDLGAIARGVVDERDIRDVRSSDLAGFTQCHFFAGIGVWSYALRLAGWPDDRPVWTGSCPCQPFSAAGKGNGFADERHLWPAWHWLIDQCRPVRIFGEQVASKVGLAWLDLVQSDLEGAGYASRAIDLCAAGVGAPHIRQRLFFVADSNDNNCKNAGDAGSQTGAQQHARLEPAGRRGISELADAESERLQRRPDDGDGGWGQRASGQGCEAGKLGDANEPRLERWRLPERGRSDECLAGAGRTACRPSPTNGFWGSPDWLGCTDGKWRPVEPGAFPLAHGTAFRVGSGSPFAGKSRAKMLRGYGNAIVAPLAAEFIAAFLDAAADAS